ncbi:hypothetical protein Moror_2388 [Moniliophthora roreri MCA 2997]|uniref:Uncharacterized protein n=1 Tax=Moniliophthora roreri (strain MCA 2997) TaxID=1381753 RepID=V2WG64_MONRO|nr:hypothetical protein Moror_2388 [Moniliophthora roreri MCA 2997]
MSATIIPPHPYESPESTTSTSSGISISTILWWIVLIMTVVYVIVSQEQQRKKSKKSSKENDIVGLLILPVPIPIMPEENPRSQTQAQRVLCSRLGTTIVLYQVRTEEEEEDKGGGIVKREND